MSHTGTIDAAPRGAVFTLGTAAEATGVSKRTLTRKIADLIEHGARKNDATGQWEIPIGALFATGFRVNAPQSEPQDNPPQATVRATPSATPSATPEIDELRAEFDAMRERAHDAEVRAARAEAEAAGANRLAHAWWQYSEGLTLALRQLQPATPTEQPRQRKSWFRQR